MKPPRFDVGQHNAHYEGHYTPRMVEWRHLGAADKTRNIVSLVNGLAATVSSVLEVGCGTGAVLVGVAAAGIGSRHVGVDVANPNDHREPAAMSMDLRCYDGVVLPFDNDSFDLVFASHVLEHVLDERGFLSELARVSKRLIYIEVPCELILGTTPRRLQNTLNIGHINAYTPDSFILTLATAGLTVASMEVFDHSAGIQTFQSGFAKGTIKRAIRSSFLKLAPTLAPKFLSYHCGALSHSAE